MTSRKALKGKLTAATKRRITADWNRLFPGLGIYKPMWLMRRVGPLLVGLCLERDRSNTAYSPTFHVQCLCKSNPHDTISLMLATELCTERTHAPESIEVWWHERGFEEAAARLARQIPLPLEGDLTLRQVLDAYRSYPSVLKALVEFFIYEDTLLLCAWADRKKQALEIFEDAGRKLSDEHVMDYVHFRGMKQADEWRAWCRRMIEEPELVRQTVSNEIKRHDVGKLPTSALIAD